MKRVSGFTLIELLISISIIGILVTIGIVAFSTINKNSRDTKRKSDVEQVRSALEMYRGDNLSYPDAGCTTASCLSVPLLDLGMTLIDYIPVIPKDPNKNQDYFYRAISQGSDGLYYGYCITVNLERDDVTDTCTPDVGYNWGVKNP